MPLNQKLLFVDETLVRVQCSTLFTSLLPHSFKLCVIFGLHTAKENVGDYNRGQEGRKYCRGHPCMGRPCLDWEESYHVAIDFQTKKHCGPIKGHCKGENRVLLGKDGQGIVSILSLGELSDLVSNMKACIWPYAPLPQPWEGYGQLQTATFHTRCEGLQVW